MAKKNMASLFMIDGCQAVRLPIEYRFKGDAVWIRRLGSAVIIEPLERAAWPDGYWERLDALGPIPEDTAVPEPLPPTPHRDLSLDEADDSGRS